MKKNRKPSKDKMDITGREGEWADECINACEKAELTIPILYRWLKKDITVNRTVTIAARILSMAEEILDNNRKNFKTIADVLRSFIYIGTVLTYRVLVTNKQPETVGSWGKTNFISLLQMQEIIGDMQQYDNHVRVMNDYFDSVNKGHVSINKFRRMCLDLIETAPEDKKKLLLGAYGKIIRKEKVSDLYMLETHGGYRSGAGRKAEGVETV